MMIEHPTLVSLMWFVFIPLFFLCNRKFIDKKYVLWYIFLYFSCLFNWISKVFCSFFSCLLMKSFWGIAVGWISFTVFYWIFLALIPKYDRQHMVSSFHDYLSNTSMGIPPTPFLPKHVIDRYDEEYKNDNVNTEQGFGK